MGRPFQQELGAIEETYNSFFGYDIQNFTKVVECALAAPVIAVGSGGSYAVASAFSLLIESLGGISKAITPFELLNELALAKCYVFLFTAGGNNPDTINAYKYIKACEPKGYYILCTNKESALEKEMISEGYYHNIQSYNVPNGKDGFLAVNSTIGLITLFERIYSTFAIVDNNIKRNNFDNNSIIESELLNKKTIIALCGKWALPVIIDLESKCSEAGLVNIQPANLRNFAHGRHHWIAKNQNDTSIICFVSEEERELAERTLGYLPDIPKAIIVSPHNNYFTLLDLFPRMFSFVNLIGKERNIDPGRPQVPAFGRKIYHINYNLLKHDEYATILNKDLSARAARRKLLEPQVCNQSNIYLKYKAASTEFVDELKKTLFHAIIFDYDNTVIRNDDTHDPTYLEIMDKIVGVLNNNHSIGFATGRGKSIVKQLRERIPREYWSSVYISYYNGTGIITLEQDIREIPQYFDINQLYQILKESFLSASFKIHNKNDAQLTLFVCGQAKEWCVQILQEIIISHNLNLSYYITDHSIDVLPKGVTKKSLHDFLSDKFNNILSIGDSGGVDGNDYFLLADRYGLSSERSSASYDSCWNLAPLGVTGPEATKFYLSKIAYKKQGFTIKI